MYICKSGHLSIRKGRQGKRGVSANQVNTYFFDIEKYKCCPNKDGYYKDGSKSKSYSISNKSDSGLIGMKMQGAIAIFTVNLKRILKLIGQINISKS